MNDQASDFELLRDFARKGDQAAFGTVVRRHLDLVYATAFRKLNDEGAAQEVAQDVFLALAKKAWQFAPDDSLPAWLHRTTLLEAKEWLRGELRRRRREHTAAELGTTMKNPHEQTAFRALVPLLDEALMSLREKDRTVLLLRFYEGRALREIGASLHVGEDAAQKRVASALERLAAFFHRRGFKSATLAATTAALQQTALSAPATAASAIVSASLKTAPPALAGLTALLAPLVTLSTARTVTVCAVVALVSVAWQWQQNFAAARDAGAWQVRFDQIRAQQEDTAKNVERLRTQSLALEEAATRDRQAKAQLVALNQHNRELLTAQDYRWPDNSPYVRIPKSAVSAMGARGPESPAGVQSRINEFLDLPPQEREEVEQLFSRYSTQLADLVRNSFYETNQARDVKLPVGGDTRVFALEPMGEKIRAALDQLSADLATLLGEDRWAMVKPPKFEITHYEQVHLLGYTQYAWDKRQEVVVSIFANDGQEPTVGVQATGGIGTSPIPLRSFLNVNPPNIMYMLGQGPPVLVDHVKEYIAAQAATRLANSSTK